MRTQRTMARVAVAGALAMALSLGIKGFAASPAQVSQPKADKPNMRFIQTNGINMRIAEMGSGPLVLLLHGWPESWYSWRHQLPALADAGFHVVAPDMRGFGKTDAPKPVEDYDIRKLTADIAGLLDALGEKSAVVVGHDWGAVVAWHCLLLYPDRFRGLVAMSVPYRGRPSESPIEILKKAYGDNFFYMLYFQEPGVAETEFDADPRGILSRLYVSPNAPRETPAVTDPKRAAGGWIPRLGAPKGAQSWLTQADLDYFVDEFKQAGFRGGINFYRYVGNNATNYTDPDGNGVVDCLQAIADLAAATANVAGRTVAIIPYGKPDFNHQKSLQQAVNQLNKALDKVQDTLRVLWSVGCCGRSGNCSGGSRARSRSPVSI